jgi:hypothetical protein
MPSIDLPTAIETLKIAEQKTREVRQGLEQQLRRQREAEILSARAHLLEAEL